MAQDERIPLDDLVKEHGFYRVCRESGVSSSTLNSTVRGIRHPSKPTIRKVSEALGVEPSQIIWPHEQQAAIYEDQRLKADIEALVERTVQRRMAEFAASQGMSGVRVAAQDMSADQVAARGQER